ncbi:LysR family transcriptional regulator [Telmatospirillum siberiense]|uniref:LysR family transcriptional regulator n=1 Tax=Telmatospirillum siberiense TaxID=382514 RepID=A0A2N3PXL2_9PROT|nr:LysR family transcriptional regulator [Telmatospirillum siberiense]PKU25154.1 LysR family transcriptional regulator [Telmatospirillum siberiense]
MDELRIAYLFETTKAGSIRGAAERLQVNASTISRQISLLEKDLGIPLLERLPRGIRATEAGRMLVDYYADQKVARDDVVAKIHELNALTRGTVQLVIGEGFIGDLLSGPLQEFCRSHPGLSLSVDVMATDGIIRAITEDEAQIGLVFNPPFDERLNTTARISRSICAIVPVGHSVAKLGHEPTLAELLPYPLACLSSSFGVQKLIDDATQRDRVHLHSSIRTNSFTLLRKFVVSGLGIALMPGFVAAEELADGLVEAVPIANDILKAAEIHIVTRHGRQLPPSALRLLGHLKLHLKAFYATANA